MAKPVKKKTPAKRATPLLAPAIAPATAKVKAKVKVKAPKLLKTVKLPKAVKRAEAKALIPFEPSTDGTDAAVLERLWAVIEQRRVAGNAGTSHSARLLSRGTQKVAQKLGEEAVELVIEAVVGNRGATISESADVLYHLLVLWVDAGIAPGEVWAELRRREGISGIAEKAARPKALVRLARTTKLP